jgi:hypothetical protein
MQIYKQTNSLNQATDQSAFATFLLQFCQTFNDAMQRK